MFKIVIRTMKINEGLMSLIQVLLLTLTFEGVRCVPNNTLGNCCRIGQNWATEARICNNIPVGEQFDDDTAKSICQESAAICCMRSYRMKRCNQGINAAKLQAKCLPSTVPGVDYFQDCCRSCLLGLDFGKSRKSCDLNDFSFRYPWSDGFSKCCRWALENLDDVTSLLPISDNLCSLFPGQLCGQICVPTPGSYYCKCRKGFSLSIDAKTCIQKEIEDRCDVSNPCSHTCRDTGMSIECTCNLGFELMSDLRSCQDVNECESPRNKCEIENKKCVNTPGSFKCIFDNDGRRFDESNRSDKRYDNKNNDRDNNDKNNDRDNNGNHNINDSNKNDNRNGNKNGSRFGNINGNINDNGDDIFKFKGFCPPGFKFNFNTQVCADINECRNSTKRCGEDKVCRNVEKRRCGEDKVCRNTIGSFVCLPRKNCPPGFYFNLNGQNCQDVDECSFGSSSCEATSEKCVNHIGSHECVKINKNNEIGSRMGTKNDEFKRDIDRNIYENGEINKVDKNLENIGGIDVFSENNAENNKLNNREKENTFEKELNHDELDDRDFHKNSDSNFNMETTIHFPSVDTNESVNKPISGNSKTVSVSTNIANNPSNNNEKIFQSNNTNINLNHNYSKNSEKNNGKNVYVKINNGIHNAKINKHKINRNNDSKPFAIDLPTREEHLSTSQSRGQGSVAGRRIGFPWINQCPTGFAFNPASKVCEDINECLIGIHTCEMFQRCSNNPGSYTCTRMSACGTGYTLNDYTGKCEDNDECSAGLNDCHQLGLKWKCVNTKGSFRCERKTCPSGQILNSRGVCINLICTPGFRPSGKKCVDVNECEIDERKCASNELCVNFIGSFRCQSKINCGRGYKMNHDGTRCLDINECEGDSHTCLSDQKCVNRRGGYSCQCKPGFKLNSKGVCEDIDECRSVYRNLCGSTGDCVNTVGSYECVCRKGFQKSNNAPHQSNCVDKNECENNGVCDHKCVNIWGSFYCTCDAGYFLHHDNRTCVDINECKEVKGRGRLCLGHCINTAGSFKCSCPTGYTLAPDQQTCKDINECDTKEENCRGEKNICVNLRGGFKCHKIDCPINYINDPKHQNRCTRARPCDLDDAVCLRKPLSYSYSFLPLSSNMTLKPTGQVDLFTMRGPSWSNSDVRFTLFVENVKVLRQSVEPATRGYFMLSTSKFNQVILKLIRSLEGPQEVTLNLNMNLYRNGYYEGTAMAKLIIFVSEYDF